MMRAAIVALLAGASAAHAAPYFVQIPAQACAKADALMKSNADCATLPKSARVEWDGKVIDGFRPHYLGGDVARVTANGRTLFVYANFLSPAPARDPLQRAFTLARDAIACPSPEKMSDALEARIERDAEWFDVTGCTTVSRGTSASRLLPETAGTETLWQMRVRISHSEPQILWMNAADFR